MGKRTMSRDELLEKKDSILEEYSKQHRKSKRLPILTKKERQALGLGKDEGRAVLMHARVSARKAALVLDLIRNKNLNEVYGILQYTPRKAAELTYKLVKSAEANAVNNNGLEVDKLFVAEAYANQGPTLKRIRPRAQGRAFRIRKRTSHITVVLKERA